MTKAIIATQPHCACRMQTAFWASMEKPAKCSGALINSIKKSFTLSQVYTHRQNQTIGCICCVFVPNMPSTGRIPTQIDASSGMIIISNSLYKSTITDHQSPIKNHRSPITNHRSPITDHIITEKYSPNTYHQLSITVCQCFIHYHHYHHHIIIIIEQHLHHDNYHHPQHRRLRLYDNYNHHH
jgi:hypothetical protein